MMVILLVLIFCFSVVEISHFLISSNVIISIIILTMTGGLFILFGLVILSYPKDFDKSSGIMMKSGFAIPLLSVLWPSGFMFKSKSIFLITDMYVLSFFFLLIFLLYSLLLIDWFMSSGMEGKLFFGKE
nr:NADH dehydrogenase subunit 6 [Pessoaiella absita]